MADDRSMSDPLAPSSAAGREALRWSQRALEVLTDPAPRTDAETTDLVGALRSDDAVERRAAQSALLAFEYSACGLTAADLAEAIASVARFRDDVVPVRQLLEETLETPLAPATREAVLGLFQGEPSVWRGWRIDLLRHVCAWSPEALSLDRLIGVGAADLDAGERDALLSEVLEPTLALRLEELEVAHLERLARHLGASPRWRLTLAVLGENPSASPAVRRWAGERLAGQLPWRAELRSALSDRPLRLLVLENLIQGQGDEAVRIGPLLQGFLAAFPELEVTLITPRPHLWESPRLRVLPIADPGAEAAVEGEWEIVVDLYEPRVVGLNHRPELHERLAAAMERYPPTLLIRGDHGATRFIYPEVRLGGRQVAGDLGVFVASVRQIYAPCHRLLIELGLPWLPAARGADRALCDPLVGSPSAESEELWHRLLPASRPRVLVNPFGGAREYKGFTRDQLDLLAVELAALVGEGVQALVLPTGTPWVTGDLLDGLVARLDGATRRHLAIAPDPAGDPRDAAPLHLRERPDLCHADRVMRLFKHFAARADRVVAIEGWLGHVAAQLGRPLRLVLMAHSFSLDWHPPGRVELCSSLSPATCEVVRSRDSLAASSPPLPRRKRRLVLERALEGLAGPLPAEPHLEALARAAASREPGIRAAAARAMGALRPAPIGQLVALLSDPAPHVGSAAAVSLLRCAQEGLGVPVPRPTLEAYDAIARQRWPKVFDLGTAALPALAVAAQGEGEIIADEARRVLEALVRQKFTAARGSQEETPGS